VEKRRGLCVRAAVSRNLLALYGPWYAADGGMGSHCDL